MPILSDIHSATLRFTLVARRIVAAGLMVWFVGGAARAEDVALQSITLRDGKECLVVLAEFNWVCRDFDKPDWIRQYDKPFWDAGGELLFYRHDLDSDGADDAIITIAGWMPRCSRGGNLCEHIVLFGGVLSEKQTRQLRTIMWGYPILTIKGSKIGIFFSQSPDTFLTIEQVKNEIKNGPILRP